MGKSSGCYQHIQHSGETIYVPEMYSHATLNLTIVRDSWHLVGYRKPRLAQNLRSDIIHLKYINLPTFQVGG